MGICSYCTDQESLNEIPQKFSLYLTISICTLALITLGGCLLVFVCHRHQPQPHFIKAIWVLIVLGLACLFVSTVHNYDYNNDSWRWRLTPVSDSLVSSAHWVFSVTYFRVVLKLSKSLVNTEVSEAQQKREHRCLQVKLIFINLVYYALNIANLIDAEVYADDHFVRVHSMTFFVKCLPAVLMLFTIWKFGRVLARKRRRSRKFFANERIMFQHVMLFGAMLFMLMLSMIFLFLTYGVSDYKLACKYMVANLISFLISQCCQGLILVFFIYIQVQFKGERLSDYREQFLLLFQSSDSQVSSLANAEAEFNQAQRYNRAAVADADLMILRVLTLGNSESPCESPASNASVNEIKKSLLSSTNMELDAEEVAILRDSQDQSEVSFDSMVSKNDSKLASVRLEEAQKQQHLVNTLSNYDSLSLKSSSRQYEQTL